MQRLPSYLRLAPLRHFSMSTYRVRVASLFSIPAKHYKAHKKHQDAEANGTNGLRAPLSVIACLEGRS